MCVCPFVFPDPVLHVVLVVVVFISSSSGGPHDSAYPSLFAFCSGDSAHRVATLVFPRSSFGS